MAGVSFHKVKIKIKFLFVTDEISLNYYFFERKNTALMLCFFLIRLQWLFFDVDFIPSSGNGVDKFFLARRVDLAAET